MSLDSITTQSPHHVVIIGGGFGGLHAARELGRASSVKVTLIDKRNYHLFQPLLYQVATGNLSPGDIASPIRGVIGQNKNTQVLMGEVVDLDPADNKLYLKDGELSYDTLVVATGVTHHYFGNDNWAPVAPGLKTIEEALEIRRRIFSAFEKAEKEPDLEKRKALLTFIVIGAGPTGVELAGALAEMAHQGLKDCFHNIDPSEATVLLLQGADRILPTFPEDLSAKAKEELEGLGVTVRASTRAMDIDANGVTVKSKIDDHIEYIGATTILWAAGVKASPMAEVLANRTSVALDRSGRVMVEPNLTVADHPNIFVIGDVANFSHQGDESLPGLAPVAQQEGVYVAKLVQQRLQARTLPAFNYADSGTLAMIGRNQAVANLKFGKFSGFTAWVMWVFVHILFLIEFDNQLLVMIQWGWSYFTRQGGARLITNRTSPEESSIEHESAVKV
ncbi:NAD(P)/FAD-dependent oxidoreductase [Lyngbya sp. PCC 8106]|uniref:NAD(P)/FAD-dependent oxidoreductase n=1 Tax=Lyngbya sp. (strain PCC 8106) TaxID=313612 RepID=UPI0000EAA2FC|nr:NAD(P)/FAD-dependent oxidoreductase [Lyngbya sp. PCC 8106]EAW36922.1 FAD-dependent pyridine nucleotide-disulphide oxidoreductase [Lyngbya sp. PCC 8106]